MKFKRKQINFKGGVFPNVDITAVDLKLPNILLARTIELGAGVALRGSRSAGLK